MPKTSIDISVVTSNGDDERQVWEKLFQWAIAQGLRIEQPPQSAGHQLHEEHRRLNVAQAIAHIGSFEWNAATDNIYWSDEMYRIHGLAPHSEAINLERVISFIHPDDMAASVEKPSEMQERTFVAEHRTPHCTG